MKEGFLPKKEFLFEDEKSLFRDREMREGKMEGGIEGKEKEISVKEITELNIKLYENYGINLADVLAIRTLLESKVGEINEKGENSQEIGELTSQIRKLKETLEEVSKANENEIKILLLLLLRLKAKNRKRN